MLVDPRLLESLTQKQYVPPDTLTDKIQDLDTQMNQVMTRDDLTDHDKAKMYQDTLQLYLKRLDQYRHKPLGLVDVKPPSVQILVQIPELEPQPTRLKETSPPQIPQLPEPTVEGTKAETVTSDRTEYRLRHKKKTIQPKSTWEKWPQ